MSTWIDRAVSAIGGRYFTDCSIGMTRWVNTRLPLGGAEDCCLYDGNKHITIPAPNGGWTREYISVLEEVGVVFNDTPPSTWRRVLGLPDSGPATLLLEGLDIDRVRAVGRRGIPAYTPEDARRLLRAIASSDLPAAELAARLMRAYRATSIDLASAWAPAHGLPMAPEDFPGRGAALARAGAWERGEPVTVGWDLSPRAAARIAEVATGAVRWVLEDGAPASRWDHVSVLEYFRDKGCFSLAGVLGVELTERWLYGRPDPDPTSESTRVTRGAP